MERKEKIVILMFVFILANFHMKSGSMPLSFTVHWYARLLLQLSTGFFFFFFFNQMLLCFKGTSHDLIFQILLFPHLLIFCIFRDSSHVLTYNIPNQSCRNNIFSARELNVWQKKKTL